MTTTSLSTLTDREVLSETRRAAGHERQATAVLISLLAEVDARRLYLGEGYSSMFTFCTGALRLSESAAYARITTARTTRRFPVLLAMLTEGSVSLTTVGLLAPHFEDDNYESLLDATSNKSKRDVERVIAGLQAQPYEPECDTLPSNPSRGPSRRMGPR